MSSSESPSAYERHRAECFAIGLEFGRVGARLFNEQIAADLRVIIANDLARNITSPGDSCQPVPPVVESSYRSLRPLVPTLAHLIKPPLWSISDVWFNNGPIPGVTGVVISGTSPGKTYTTFLPALRALEAEFASHY